MGVMKKADRTALNNFYKNLNNFSPRTTKEELPRQVGEGKIAQTVTRKGVLVSEWNVCFHEDVEMGGSADRDYLSAVFCMREGISWRLGDRRQELAVGRGESCIYRSGGVREEIYYPGKESFSFRCVKIPVNLFERLLETYFAARERQVYHRALMEEMPKVSMTPDMYRILDEIWEYTKYRGGISYLYLEGKVTELLSVYLQEILETCVTVREQPVLARSDMEDILEVRRWIDGHIAYVPNCDNLARSVHMSTSKFARCFQQIFGMPVHAYIIEKRLEQAARLLTEEGMNVSQAAAAVGYTKSSNMSAAFKKKYGVSPKEYRLRKFVAVRAKEEQ